MATLKSTTSLPPAQGMCLSLIRKSLTICRVLEIELKEIVAALESELVRVEDVGERRSPAAVESFLMKLYGQTWRADPPSPSTPTPLSKHVTNQFVYFLQS